MKSRLHRHSLIPSYILNINIWGLLSILQSSEVSLELCCSMIGADALRASNDHQEQRLKPPRGPGASKCAKLLCSGRRARVLPSTACDYATAPPFIRAASRCVSFVEGYRSMWLQPVEQCTQRATTPVKACGKKVCRLVIFLL